MFARIQRRVATGQWELIGGMWVEPDTNMPTGESLARQLLYGQRYFERSFGARSTVCWLPDCFGFSPALPQLLRQAGIDSFFTIKVNWSESNRFPHDLFWWEGLDGSRVLAHTFDNPLSGYNGKVRPDGLAPTWRNFRGKVDHNETLLAVGYGDGGGGVTPEMIERERQLRDFPVLPSARWDSVRDFFLRAHATARSRELPAWSGEIYLELHRATLTTQSGVKRKHRAAERALIAAEAVACLAHLMGAPAPASLEPLWRGVLKNEFHDILPGSSIREVYEDAEKELDAVITAGRDVQARAMTEIVAGAPKGPLADPLVVVNPSLSARPLRLRSRESGDFARRRHSCAARRRRARPLETARGGGAGGRPAPVLRTRICGSNSATMERSRASSTSRPGARRSPVAAINSGPIRRTNRAPGTPGTSMRTIAAAGKGSSSSKALKSPRPAPISRPCGSPAVVAPRA